MIRRLVVATGLLGFLLTVVADPAPAQAPDAQGWWYVAGSPLGLAPPYVPEDGLYVASNPSGPEAVSALRFTLAGGGTAGTLQLKVEGEIRGEPVVGLCAVAEKWEPVQAGPLADAPACDPGGTAVPGTVAADGTTVTFPVALLARDGALDVALVPGQDANGVNATFQLVLAKPGPEALTTGGDASTTAPPTAEGEPVPVFEPAPSPVIEPPPPSSSAADFVPQPPSAPLGEPAAVTTPPAAAGDGAVVDPFGEAPAQAAAPVADDDGGGGLRIVGIVLLAATAFAYHRLSIMPDRAPRSLVSFGQLSTEETQ